MGSSAQNSSGVHWCRRRVRFDRVPEKVPEKVWEKVWEALVQSSTGFRRRFWRRSGRVFRRRLWRRFREALVQRAGQVQQGSEEGSGEGLGGFGAEAGQVQRRCGRLWCRARSGSTGFRRKFWRRSGRVFRRRFRRRCGRLWCRGRLGATGFQRLRRRFPDALAQSQVRFRSGEGLGGFGAEPGQAQEGSGEGSGEALVQGQVKFNGSEEGCRSQTRSGSFNSRKPSWGVSSAWLCSTLQKDL